MFQDVIGDWPTHDKFILTSCDEKYFQQYFPRFYKTYTEFWNMPIHVHVIDPSEDAEEKLQRLDLSYSICHTDERVLKWPYSYETYCQAQRFILLGFKMLEGQSVIVADVDSYALKTPSEKQRNYLSSGTGFTKYNGRLMATFCNVHSSHRSDAHKAALKMKELIESTDKVGVDQLVIKEIFSRLEYNNLRHGEWIRHYDVKTDQDVAMHKRCLVYHEKGTRGKNKTVEITWTDIGL